MKNLVKLCLGLMMLLATATGINAAYDEDGEYIGIPPTSEAYDDSEIVEFITPEMQARLDANRNKTSPLARAKVTLSIPRYWQNDERWKDKKLGVCTDPAFDTIGEAGCALVSVTMVYNYLSGENWTPLKMNEEIMTNSCAMVWSSAARQLGITYAASGSTSDSRVYDLVKEYIDASVPVILRVEGAQGSHYVVANGYNTTGEVVYIKDPGDPNYTELTQYLNDGWTVIQYHVYTE